MAAWKRCMPLVWRAIVKMLFWLRILVLSSIRWSRVGETTDSSYMFKLFDTFLSHILGRQGRLLMGQAGVENSIIFLYFLVFEDSLQPSWFEIGRSDDSGEVDSGCLDCSFMEFMVVVWFDGAEIGELFGRGITLMEMRLLSILWLCLS